MVNESHGFIPMTSPSFRKKASQFESSNLLFEVGISFLGKDIFRFKVGKRALRDPERASKEFFESKLWQET